MVVNDIRIMNGKNGPFVAMPTTKKGDEFKDIVFPTSKEGRARLNTILMDAYNEALMNKERAAEKPAEERPSAADKLNEAKDKAAKAPKTPKAEKNNKSKSDPSIE